MLSGQVGFFFFFSNRTYESAEGRGQVSPTAASAPGKAACAPPANARGLRVTRTRPAERASQRGPACAPAGPLKEVPRSLLLIFAENKTVDGPGENREKVVRNNMGI